MTTLHKLLRGICALSFCTVIMSCTALNTFPYAARSGDTVALAVGSPEGMDRSNTTATFISDADGVPVDITPNIRSIFKLYADPESKVYEATGNLDDLVASSLHAPWLTVVAIDLPQGLQLGPGQVEFSTTATYPDVGSHINDVPIGIEILSGAGTNEDFEYEFGIGSSLLGNLTDLEVPASSRVVFGPSVPSVACPCPDYAAIEVKATIPTSLGVSLPNEFIRIIPDNLNIFTNSDMSFVHGLSDGQELTAIFMSNEGSLKFYEATFSVVLNTLVSFAGTPVINSVKYYDVNGNEVAGPVADYNVAIQ